MFNGIPRDMTTPVEIKSFDIQRLLVDRVYLPSVRELVDLFPPISEVVDFLKTTDIVNPDSLTLSFPSTAHSRLFLSAFIVMAYPRRDCMPSTQFFDIGTPLDDYRVDGNWLSVSESRQGERVQLGFCFKQGDSEIHEPLVNLLRQTMANFTPHLDANNINVK